MFFPVTSGVMMLAMIQRGSVYTIVLGATLSALLGQAPPPERAALAARPLATAADGPTIRVVDWLSGAPLGDALVLAVPQRAVAGVPRTQAGLSAVAAKLGVRVALDRAGLAVLPRDHVALALHGEAFALGTGTLVPVPPRTVVLQCNDLRGGPRRGVTVMGVTTDRDGRAVWQVDPRLLVGTRFLGIGGTELFAWGMLAPEEAVVDLHDPALTERAVHLPCGSTATLELLGVRDGAPEELGLVELFWRPPFALNLQFRKHLAGASIRCDDLPAGVPVHVRLDGARERLVTLTADRTTRLELPVPAPAPRIRYRLVDDAGRALRGRSSGDLQLDDHGTLLLPRGKEALVRVFDEAGEEWSCVPFVTPDGTWRGIRDGGDLVLQAGSRTEFCRGRIVDRAGKPLATVVWLGDGQGVWGHTESGADGRFRLCAGAWLRDPMTLCLPEYGKHLTEPIRPGDREVSIVVGVPRSTQARIDGQVTGSGIGAWYPPVGVRVRRAGGSAPAGGGSLQQDGWFHLPLNAGTYDVELVLSDATVLPFAAGVEVSADAQAAASTIELHRPLPPSHRVATLRLVDRGGSPCQVYRLSSDPTATVQAIVPAGGTVLEVPAILQRVELRGDLRLTLDPALVEVEVRGLPAGQGWHFGLGIGIPGSAEAPRIGRLVAGRGRMFVPRGVPLQAHLFATRYDAAGEPVPFQIIAPPALSGFDGACTVPADGAAPCVRFAAPVDLDAQLAAIAGPARPR